MTKNYTLITGASSGIGLELAKVAASQNHNLVLVARGKTELNSVQKMLGDKVDVKIMVLDLSKLTAPNQIKKYCTEQKITIDILVNNAGFGDLGEFVSSDLSRQLSMIDLNVRSLTELTHLFLPEIIKNNGKIMNLASTAAFLPGPGMSVYYGTKHFVLAFSEALSSELSDTGVTVTALCPGPTKTNFAKSAHAANSSLFKGSLPSAQEVAKYGWRAMYAGKRIAVYGTRNKILTQLVRFMPRSVVLKTVRRIQTR